METHFLSFPRRKGSCAHSLTRGLQLCGVPIWCSATRNRPAVGRWIPVLEKALRECKVFVILIDEFGVDGWVDQELGVALHRAAHDQQFLIVPLLTPRVDESSMPLFLQPWQCAHLPKNPSKMTEPEFAELAAKLAVSGAAAA